MTDDIEQVEVENMAEVTHVCRCSGCTQMRLLAIFVFLELQGDPGVQRDAQLLLALWERRLAQGRAPLRWTLTDAEGDALERCTTWAHGHRRETRMLANVVGWSGGTVD